MATSNKSEQAHELCDSGKFREALERFKQLESESIDSLERAGYLADEATCYAELGDLTESQDCICRAKQLVGGDSAASAQIDFLAATLLLEHDQREQGLEALRRMLSDYASWLESSEGRELYEKVQVQRGFTLMHLSRGSQARPVLEEAACFQLESEVKSRVHCHLGRCYHELGEYELAKAQFLLARIGHS